MVKTVAVIGAGVSGLSAIKACLEEGLEPTCFERSDDIGGLWRFTEEVEDGRASIYRSLVSNVSKETMCFSDFPMPSDFPNFLPHHKYFAYLKLFVERYNLLKYINFKTAVCRVEKHSDFPTTGQWKITTESNGEKKTAVYDAVFVCTGQHMKPNIPIHELPGIQNFKGKVLHSREYKRPLGYDGKRVLIVGLGNSGADLATELCTIASQVYLATRNGVWVIPRLGKGGYPFDVFLLRRFSSWVDNMVPPIVSRWMRKQMLNDRCSHELYNFEPVGTAWKAPLVNEELPSRILSGSIIMKPGVTRFTETAAHFSDGSIVDNIDVIILCTGYHITFPFLEESDLREDACRGHLYKHIIPPVIEKPTIAFIALLVPIGSLMTTAEMQCRWATRLFKGLHKLPNAERMKEEILKEEKKNNKWYPVENCTPIIEYIGYLDDLASDIGVKPNILRLFLTDPVLAFNIVFGTCCSYHFRLSGPGKWAGAREATLTMWDRIEKPLRTRKAKNTFKSPLTSLLLIICFGLLFLAIWIKY